MSGGVRRATRRSGRGRKSHLHVREGSGGPTGAPVGVKGPPKGPVGVGRPTQRSWRGQEGSESPTGGLGGSEGDVKPTRSPG